jgi:hypothetical protein
MNKPDTPPQFLLLDYNGLLSEASLTHPSAQDRQGKFMLVERNGIIHLVMGSVNVYGYHADLLAQFCRDHEILHDWIHRPANLAIRDDSVILHGGGWVGVKPKEGRVAFYGKSTAYGAFESAILEPLLPQIKVPDVVSVWIG